LMRGSTFMGQNTVISATRLQNISSKVESFYDSIT
jgi:hypothetical protein